MLAAAAAMAGGCGAEDGGGAARGGAPAEPAAAGEAVELVRHAYYPRELSENYWEVVPLAETGPHFLLMIHPRIRTPAEGPWTITFVDPEGNETARHEGLHVDTATGAFTFLCTASRFAPGDWTILLEVPEGGMVAGPREREYRFRVE
jgi:hypothetical protein